ncbi:MAG: VOC family protein [Candidatus Baltobacteraceae bacterium]
MSTRGIDATFFQVKDMKRARAFYDAILGVAPNVMSEEYWAEYTFADGTTFAVAYNPSAPWRGGSGVLLGVDNLEEAARRAQENGGTLTGVEFGGKICKSKECIDTEGNYLYLHERF